MKLLQDILNVKKEIEKSSKHITSSSSKILISNFYKEIWLPISEKFKQDFGIKIHDKIEINARKIYNLSKRQHFLKTEVMKYLSQIEIVLEGIEFEIIRKNSIVSEDAKYNILDYLNRQNFLQVLSYIQKAKNRFSEKEWKDCCHEIRLAAEEFFRKAREIISKKSVKRGTLGEHLIFFQKEQGLISFAERSLIQYGFYAFLSEKGSHANEETTTEEDAKISFDVFYILIEYALDKITSRLE